MMRIPTKRTGLRRAWVAMVAVISVLLTVSAVQPAIAVATGSTSSGWDIFDPSAGGQYRYGPSMILNSDNSIDAWTCSPGTHPSPWDYIRHSRSTDGGTSWAPWTIAYAPSAGDRDQLSACDPGVFKYGGYYYMGYTSIEQNYGGNELFVARSTTPTGPWQKWNGTGWGSNPVPFIEYSGPVDTYGVGEPSFVIKDSTLYIYYTWDSRDPVTHQPIIQTRVSTASISNVNWPGATTYQGVAIDRVSGEDSTDHKYVPSLGKFIAIGAAQRFTNDSRMKMWESADGITYRPATLPAAYADLNAHNAGVTGNDLGHLDTSKPNKIAYAYGTVWGYWYTAMQPFTVSNSTLPAVPDLKVAQAGNGSALLEFATSGVPGVTYTIRYGTTSGTYTASIPSVTGSPYTVTGLTNGTEYYFVVDAVSPSGSSAHSRQIAATPLAYAATPRIAASASSSIPGWGAANAIDSDPTGTVYSSVGHASGTGSEWVTVDTGASRGVKRVTLTPRTELFGFPIAPSIQVSNDNVNWTQATYDLGEYRLRAPLRFVYELDQALNARYVRVNVSQLYHDDTTPFIYYFQLADIKIEEVPLASTASSTLSGWSSVNVTDGNASTVWSSVSHSTPSAVESVGLDLGSPRLLTGLRVTPRATGTAFPIDFKVQTSANGSTWTDAPGATYSAYPNPGNLSQTLGFSSAVNARYVRLYATKLGTDTTAFYLQVADLSPVTDARRTASASSSIAGAGTSPSNLVDSQPRTVWSSLGHGTSSATEWATVDMGSVQNWSRLRLYTTAGDAFPIDFKIQSSTDGSSWTTISGLDVKHYWYFPGSPATNPGTGPEVFTFGQLVSARYFRVQATQLRADPYGNFYMQMNEIIVDR